VRAFGLEFGRWAEYVLIELATGGEGRAAEDCERKTASGRLRADD